MSDKNTTAKTIEKFTGKLRKEDTGFTMLLNNSLNKITDIAALGLYCYLSSKPDDWSINVKEISSHFKIGRDKTYKLLNYLIEIGALSVGQSREQGRYTAISYFLHIRLMQSGIEPCPENQETVKESPLPEKAYTANTHTYKTKKDLNKTKKDLLGNAREAPKNLISSPPPIKTEEPEMIDPNYEYPDTYYKSPAKQQFNLTSSEQESFEIFWSMYPMKKGKDKAEVLWFTEGCYRIAQTIFNKLSDQISRDAHFLRGFIPNPSKYILEKRYNDDVFVQKRSATAKSGKFDASLVDVNDVSWALASRKSSYEL